MTKEELTRKVHAAIDRRAEEIVALGEQIRQTPELGFKEERTARLAVGAGEVLSSRRPRMTRDEYLAFQRGLEERRVYTEGEVVT